MVRNCVFVRKIAEYSITYLTNCQKSDIIRLWKIRAKLMKELQKT